jgi:carbonic anhydrase
VLSQLNVLAQIEHLRTYPAVKEMEAAGRLAVHGWWFDIAGADVYAFDRQRRRFIMLDEPAVREIIEKSRD